MFTFKVIYIEGSENVVANALLRVYANDSPGTIRSNSELMSHDVLDDDTSQLDSAAVDVPILAGMEARVATRHGSRVCRPTEKAAQGQVESPQEFAAQMRDHFILRGPPE